MSLCTYTTAFTRLFQRFRFADLYSLPLTKQDKKGHVLIHVNLSTDKERESNMSYNLPNQARRQPL